MKDKKQSDFFNCYSPKLKEFLSEKGLVGEQHLHKHGFFLVMAGSSEWENHHNPRSAYKKHPEIDIKTFVDGKNKAVRTKRIVVIKDKDGKELAFLKRRIYFYTSYERTEELSKALKEWKDSAPVRL